MRKLKGFKLGRKVVKVFNWVIKSKCNSTGYHRLDTSECKTRAITKYFNWGNCLKRRVKRLCFPKLSSDYTRVGEDLFDGNPVVPKGHLAVYVGQKDDDPHRCLVPVIYFNHPLFGELLREAKEEYGFEQPGGITIPCPISEFENVKMKIAAGESCRKLRWMRRS